MANFTVRSAPAGDHSVFGTRPPLQRLALCYDDLRRSRVNANVVIQPGAEMEDVTEAARLWCCQETHRLRKLAFGDLAKLAIVPSKWIRPFRSHSVGLAALAAPIDDASLVVGVRAFVLPAFLTRFVVYDGFTKFADESWRKRMPPEAYDLLRAKLDELVPMI